MGEFRDEFERGRQSAKLTSYTQVAVRVLVDGSLIAFLIWGPSRFWIRLVVAIVVRLVYGAIASAPKNAGKF